MFWNNFMASLPVATLAVSCIVAVIAIISMSGKKKSWLFEILLLCGIIPAIVVQIYDFWMVSSGQQSHSQIPPHLSSSLIILVMVYLLKINRNK